jgi:MFS family permease
MQEHFQDVNNAALWVRLVLTLPALFIVAGSLIAGVVVDRFGRKPLLLAAAALYGLAGTSGYVLDSLFHILIGRASLGLAVAGIMVTATTLIAEYYSGPARAAFLGLQAAFMGLGGVVFLSLGGFLADQNWRFPFLIYGFAWVLLPLMDWAIAEPQCTSLPATQANAPSSQPAFPVKLLAFIYGVALLTQIIFYLIPAQLPFYLKELVNANASQSGLAIALATLFSCQGVLVLRQNQAAVRLFQRAGGRLRVNGRRLQPDWTGGAVCVSAGRVGDRWGRTRTADAQSKLMGFL